MSNEREYVCFMDCVKRSHEFSKAIPWLVFDYTINPYLGVWYAEERLYVLCDCMVDAIYFQEADSPYDAVKKVLERIEEANQAGKFSEEQE